MNKLAHEPVPAISNAISGDISQRFKDFPEHGFLAGCRVVDVALVLLSTQIPLESAEGTFGEILLG